MYSGGYWLEFEEGLIHLELLWLVPVSKQIKVFTYPEFLCAFLIVRFSNSVLITPSLSAFVRSTLVNAFKSTVNFETTPPKVLVVV